jgi:hypothetical protein
MPASEMLVFNKTDHLQGILVEEGLARGNVNNGSWTPQILAHVFATLSMELIFLIPLMNDEIFLRLLSAIAKLFLFCSSSTSFFATATKIWSSCGA